MILLLLMWEFFKTGLFAIGGGLATLPFLYEMSVKTGWFTATDIANMIAISESTPGPLGINMATYVGYNTAGVAGAILAPIGEVLPSIIIILIIAKVLEKFKENQIVQDVFYGLRPASVGLIAAAGVEVVKVALLNTANWTGFTLASIMATVNWPCLGLAALLLVLTRLPKIKKAHPLYFILGSACVGIAFGYLGWS
ncbi:chromate transporter [Christensenellaceae bacterium NSJ-63]|uniref:Chromate transporter n=1 Tax=Guopingia tenuis TaxID=2763656 RepID=A0A926DIN2_9FIRM|nr:chromate transporter [Guopingia tenuis]MBC8538482.1 chromate transporter [Guopingia tenuis]